ncbi:MAG: hypothetical protein IPG02_15695 [Ignavibacteria bacterium]|nr:hypothetical protein [Ignavibacteria bacterium]
MKWTIGRLSVEKIFNSKKTITSLEYLRELGFSERIIEDFWIPFYQGVFLENTLDTDSRMPQFTFKCLQRMGLPYLKRMDAIPRQLVDILE